MYTNRTLDEYNILFWFLGIRLTYKPWSDVKEKNFENEQMRGSWEEATSPTHCALCV